MCIICVKMKGNQFPSVENVKNMCDNNPDGFAMSYYTPKGVKIFKTLNQDEFLSEYKKVMSLDKDKTSLIIHTRIKTHGTMRIENCHCWRDKSTGLVFAHNGILSIKNREDMTDSETFFRDIFIPIYKSLGWEGAKKAIDAIISSSKFAFMGQKGDVITFGNYIKADDGNYYTNTTYQKQSINYGSYWDDAWGSRFTINGRRSKQSPSVKGKSIPTYSGLKDESVWYAEKHRSYYKSNYNEEDFGLTWNEFKEMVEKSNEEYYRFFTF